jgi:hypothetical protein
MPAHTYVSPLTYLTSKTIQLIPKKFYHAFHSKSYALLLRCGTVQSVPSTVAVPDLLCAPI